MNNISRKHFNIKRQQQIGREGVKIGGEHNDNALYDHALNESIRMIDVLYKYADKICSDSFKHIKNRVNEELIKDSSNKASMINNMYDECMSQYNELFNRVVEQGFASYIEHNDYTFLSDENQKLLLSMIKDRTNINLNILMELIKEMLKAELAEFFDSEEEITYSDDIKDEALDVNLEVNDDVSSEIIEMQLKYIRKFVDLSNFARDYDFKFLKQNGNHTHFKNDEGMLITMTNKKTVGKGVSFTIQKAIISCGKEV